LTAFQNVADTLNALQQDADGLKAAAAAKDAAGLTLDWSGEIPAELREALERYNEEDCRSTASLRKWLEEERQKLVDAGAAIARPELGDGALASSRKQSQLVGRVSVTRFG